jgi:hypothetical protein
MSPNEIFGKLKLTSVTDTPGVPLPGREFVSEILGSQLKILGMSTRKLKVTQYFKNRARISKKDPEYSLENLREGQGDILGFYCHNYGEPEVILYVDSCLRASEDLSVPGAGLLQIVLIHELAHHATASAVVKDRNKNIFSWEDYDKCNEIPWPSVHEYFAQSLAFVCVAEHHAGLLKALRSLSKQQSPIYRTWEVLDAFAQNKAGPHSMRASLKAQFLALMKSNGSRSVPEIEESHLVKGYDE